MMGRGQRWRKAQWDDDKLKCKKRGLFTFGRGVGLGWDRDDGSLALCYGVDGGGVGGSAKGGRQTNGKRSVERKEERDEEYLYKCTVSAMKCPFQRLSFFLFSLCLQRAKGSQFIFPRISLSLPLC